ncbi:MAG: IPT/TIG domain-containing protein, partial [Blastocatellia bacterium]
MPVAPDSIVSAFGARLATDTVVANSLPLPRDLAGTTVKVNGELAQLFFVSPTQINFLIPAGTPAGTASVAVTSGDGMVSNGTAPIAPVAPALFTANADGKGPLASLLLRVKANGQQSFEPLVQFDKTQNRFVTLPIDFGEESDLLYLILFLTGARQAATSNVRVVIGGVEYAPAFVGAQGGYAGLDQINLLLPRNFGGRGRISLLVKAAGYGASNACEFEIGGTKSPLNLKITGVSRQPVLAGEEIEVSGSGFAANPRENLAQIVSDDGVPAKADVLAVSADLLRIRVPYGAGKGKLKISRGEGENKVEANLPINVRTSMSGFVEEAQRQPDGS